MSSYLAKQQAYKEDPEAFAEGQYFGASMMPVTGEAIATYELPGILSQAKTLMQDPNYKKALLGLGLGILGTASVAPGIGPLARGAKKGLEGFIPYLGPQTSLAGVPGIDPSITKIIASEEATGGSEKIAKHIELSSKKKKKKDIFKENKSFVDPLDNKISFEIDTRKADLLEGSVKKTDRGFFGSHFLKPNPNQEYGFYKLEDLLTGMDDLFKQYPDLKSAYVQPFNGVVEHNGQLVQAGGAVDFQDFVIKLGPGYSQKNLTEKLLHETQHLVDFIEGRQPGGTPLMFSGTAKQNERNYKRLAGEVRARLVQDRFYYNLQDEFPRPDTSPKKVLDTEEDIMEVGGQSFMTGFGKDPTNLTPGKVSDIEKARELGQEELFPSAVKKGDDIQGSIYATKDVKGEKADYVFTYGPGSLFDPAEKKGRKLLIISCSETKCPDDKNMKAIDRYLGPVFQTLKAQGVPENVDVAIMSAKHGLITANTPLKNYNEKMTKAKAQSFKNDPDQLNRIRNTMMGYDKVIVQGGEDYKDVLRTAAGDLKINEIPGGRGIGDQRQFVMDAIDPFRKIKTPVYHYSPDVQLNFTKFDPDKSPAVIDSLGVHVGTKKAARDRFETRMGLGTGQLPGIDDVPTGNVGYGPDGKPIPRTTFGGTFPLLADTTKPFTPSTADSKRFAGAKEWSEFDLNEHLIDEFNKTLPKGQDFDGYYTMKHLSAEPGYEDFPFAKFREFVKEYRKKLAKDGFTHIPYLNDVEDPGSVSFIMLVDRPKGKTKVLQSPFAKKDEEAFDDPDFMKAEGGVVEMKDKAVNMYRGTQGIEPFIKYMV